MADEPNGKSIIGIANQDGDDKVTDNIPSGIIKHSEQSNNLSKQIDTNQQSAQSSSTDDMGGEVVKPSSEVSRKGNDLDPVETNTIDIPKPTKVPEENTPVDAEPKESSEDQPVSNDPYEPVDSLPGNDIKTAEATNGMQSPKIYDTKEYFVPIKDTNHSHGGMGIFIAGLVSAVVVLAVVVFVAMAKY